LRGADAGLPADRHVVCKLARRALQGSTICAAGAPTDTTSAQRQLSKSQDPCIAPIQIGRDKDYFLELLEKEFAPVLRHKAKQQSRYHLGIRRVSAIMLSGP